MRLKSSKRRLIRNHSKASIYFDMGQVHMSKKDFPAAETAFRKALEIDPKFHRARVALAQLYAATGKQEQAEQELLLATKADPENEELLHVLGNFYSSTRRYDDLEKLYQDLLKKKPDSLIAKKRLVEIYFTKNDRKQAKQYIDEILKSNANDNDGLYFRGRLNLADNEIKKSAEDLAIVTRNAPKFALGWLFSRASADAAKRNQSRRKSDHAKQRTGAQLDRTEDRVGATLFHRG